ncbi:MAG: hypothetical protein QXO60_00075 [Candidatus Micrarchaeia archaeon]
MVFEETSCRAFYTILNHIYETEIRYLDKETGIVRSIFVNNIDDFVENCRSLSGKAQIWVGINERNKRGKTLQDIRYLNTLIIDIDSIRKDEYGNELDGKDTPATEEEMKLAYSCVEKVINWFKIKGFKEPIVACSGNGYYLIASLPKTEINDQNRTEWNEKYKQFYHVLKKEIGTIENAKIDIFDIAKTIRVIGTKNIKGKEMQDRPHRLAHFITPITQIRRDPDHTLLNFISGLEVTFNVRSVNRIVDLNKIPQETYKKIEEIRKEDIVLDKYLNGDQLEKKSQSEADFLIVCRLIDKYKFTIEEITACLKMVNVDRKPNPSDYIRRTYEKASEYIRTRNSTRISRAIDLDTEIEISDIYQEKKSKVDNWIKVENVNGHDRKYIAMYEDKCVLYTFIYNAKTHDIKVREAILLNCSLTVKAIGRASINDYPILVIEYNHKGRKKEIRCSVQELTEILVNEGLSCVKKSDLDAYLPAIISNARYRLEEQKGLKYIGVHLNENLLKWMDDSNGLFITNNSAIRTENYKMYERFKRIATEQEVKDYSTKLKQLADTLPIEWRSNLFFTLGHGLMSHIAPLMKEESIAFAMLTLLGPQKTTKTPQLRISTALFGDREIYTRDAVSGSSFRENALESRVGILAIDEAQGSRDMEREKAKTTSNIRTVRGTSNQKLQEYRILATKQITSNYKIKFEEDEGEGIASRLVYIYYPQKETKASKNFEYLLSELTEPNAGFVGRYFIELLIKKINYKGWKQFVEQTIQFGHELESIFDYSKKSQTIATTLYGMKIISEEIGYTQEEIIEMMANSIINIYISDLEDRDIEDFINFVHDNDEAYLDKKKIRYCDINRDEKEYNTFGKFYYSYYENKEVYLITQSTLELYRKYQGIKSMKELKQFAKKLQKNGINVLGTEGETKLMKINGKGIRVIVTDLQYKNDDEEYIQTKIKIKEIILKYIEKIIAISSEISGERKQDIKMIDPHTYPHTDEALR